MVLLDEARALLDHADHVRVRVSAAAGVATITVGILGDGTHPGLSRLAADHRRSHPGIDIRIRDTDLSDPTCGLRAGLNAGRRVGNTGPCRPRTGHRTANECPLLRG